MIERHGFEPSAVRARIKARMAVVDLANGRPTVARASDDQAAWALRKLSRERPPDRPKAADLLAVLKAAMVAAHPDKGGDSDTVRRGSAKYVEARRAARAAKEATATVPIVLAMVSDADRLGLIASLPRPGGNITGLSSQIGDTAERRHHEDIGSPLQEFGGERGNRSSRPSENRRSKARTFSSSAIKAIPTAQGSPSRTLPVWRALESREHLLCAGVG